MTRSSENLQKNLDTLKPFFVGEWCVDPDSGRIQHKGAEVKLEPKVMSVLVCLAQNPGKVVSREALEQAVWEGTIVGYDALSSSIIKLRKAMGDNSRNPQYIETVSKKGYRLIVQVRQTEQTESKHIEEETQPTRSESSNKPHSNKKLKRNAGMVAVLIIVVGVIFLLIFNSKAPPQQPAQAQAPEAYKQGKQTVYEKPSLVVLPFENLSNDPQQEYFSDGITDDLITDLSQVSGLTVIARRSSYIYKQRTGSIASVAKDLGVQFVVEGSVRRSNGNIRINVQLVNTSIGANIWAERFDRKVSELFKMQDDIREKILSALSVKLTELEQSRTRNKYTASIEAYDYFLQGQSSLVKRASAVDNQQAQSLLQKAIDIDPKFARAMGALALTYADAYRFAWTDDPESTAKLSLQLAKQARAIDNYSPQIHWVLGYVYLFLFRDHEKAIAMGERTLELDPNHADGYTLLAVTYVYTSEYEDAVKLIKTAMRLNPHYPSQYPGILGLANLFLGRYEEALQGIEESLLINASRLNPNVFLTVLYYRTDRLEDAKWQYEQLLSIHPNFNIQQWANRQPFRDKKVSAALANDLNNICCGDQ